MLKTLSKKFYSRGFLESFLTIVGNFIATGISAVALIIISRYLGPEEFGVFSVGFAVVLIVTKIVDFGTNNVILKFATVEQSEIYRNAVFAKILRFRLLLSFILILLGIVLSPLLAKILNFSNTQILYLSFSVGLATSYYEYLLTILQSFHRFFEAVIANVLQAVVKLACTLLLLLGASMSTITIFSWYIAAPLAPFFIINLLLPKEVSIFTIPRVELPIAKMMKFAQHSSIALITAGIIENVDILFVTGHLDLYETGLYSGVVRIALVFSLIAYSLASVLNARVARYKSKADLSVYIKKSFLVLLGSVIGFLVFIPFAPILVQLTIGPEYLSGSSYLIILTAASFLAVATVPFLALFYSFEADWYFSSSGIFQLLIVIAGNMWFVPEYGLSGAAWTRFAARLFLFAFTIGMALWVYRRKYVQTQKTP